MEKLKKIKKKHIFRAIAAVLIVAITAVSIDNSGRVKVRLEKQAGGTTPVYAKTDNTGITSNLEREIELIRSGIDDADMDEIKSAANSLEGEIKNVKDEMQKQFAEAEEKVSATNSPVALVRLNEFRNATETGFEEIEKDIESVYRSVSEEEISKAKDILLSVVEKAESMTEMEDPVVEMLDMPHNTAQEYNVTELVGGQIPESEVYDDVKVADEETDLKVKEVSEGTSVKNSDADAYEKADYTSIDTPELQLTDEIKDLADNLKTPVKIYEYVRNAMDYRMYYGSRYGAKGTYSQMAGNDYDQASLLIAMLRYKGFEARYVMGTVQMDVEDAMNLTGARTAKAAVDAMAMLGVPAGYVSSGGKISAVRVEHVWVEVKIPYDDYRGTGRFAGEDEWIPLDPSYKKYEEIENVNISDIIDYSEEEIQDCFYMTGKETEYGETLLNAEEMLRLYDEVESNIQSYVDDNDMDSETAKEFAGKRTIIKEENGVLPNALPYRVIEKSAVYDMVPRKAVAEITLALTESFYGSYFMDTPDVSVTYDASWLYGKRVTVVYAPETEEDEKLIESYGGIHKTPSYLVKVVPQILIDGEVVAEGNPVLPGDYFQVTIGIKQAGCDEITVENPLIAGGNYAIAFDYGIISESQIKECETGLKELSETVIEEERHTDKVMGEVLHSMGILYFCQTDILNSYIAAATGVRAERLISETIVGLKPKVSSLFGVPVAITEGAYYIDVDTDVQGVVSLDENEASAPAYMLMSGIMGSNMESVIFEQTLDMPAVSTISILREANERGIGIATITRDNANIVEKLDIDGTAKSEIAQAVKNGKTVIVPESDICFYEWSGTGYIIIDPETCAGAYMVSGSICGGMSAIFSISVGMINIIWAMIDLCGIVTALMAATTPLAVVGFYFLYVLSVVALVNSIYTMLAYCQTMDERYAGKMAFDLAMNVIITAAFHGLSVLVKSQDELAEGVIKKVDDVTGGDVTVGGNGSTGGNGAVGGDGTIGGSGSIGGVDNVPTPIDDLVDYWKWAGDTYGTDVSKVIAEHGEKGRELLEKYGDSFAGAVSKVEGADDVVRLINDYPESADDILDAISKYGDEVVDLIDSYGDDAIEQFKAGKSLDEVKKLVIGSNLNSYDDFYKYITDIGKRNDLTDAQKILKIQEAFELSNYKTDINVPSDIQYIKGFDVNGNVIYDWPPKLGFDESTITSITRENGLPDVWDRYGYMGGSNFADVPSTGKYSYSERAIPYVQNEAAYHTGIFNNVSYFDKIDAIRSKDINAFNNLLENEGISKWKLDEFEELCDSYDSFIEKTKQEIGSHIDATYGLKGKASEWGDMSGGAGQIVTPFGGDILKRIGIILEI